MSPALKDSGALLHLGYVNWKRSKTNLGAGANLFASEDTATGDRSPAVETCGARPGKKREARGRGCARWPHLTAAKEEASSAGPDPCPGVRHPGPVQASGGLLEPGFRQLRERAERRGFPGRADPAAPPPDTRMSRRLSEASLYPPSRRHPTAPYPERPTRCPQRSTNFPPLSRLATCPRRCPLCTS